MCVYSGDDSNELSTASTHHNNFMSPIYALNKLVPKFYVQVASIQECDYFVGGNYILVHDCLILRNYVAIMICALLCTRTWISVYSITEVRYTLHFSTRGRYAYAAAA